MSALIAAHKAQPPAAPSASRTVASTPAFIISDTSMEPIDRSIAEPDDQRCAPPGQARPVLPLDFHG
jgi:hypothetical protein